ncbi:hypothetical protein [Streptomyces sp. NPDC001380]|uniref:hypothetical protein n=1 Tax=Streptomyces sp. NPDC001380 TaxID=3364566 RepID=UPI0036A8E12D
MRLSLADVIRDMEAKGVIVVGDYANNRIPIECICIWCGALVHPTYSNAMREGVGLCDQQCKRDRIGDSNRRDGEVAARFALANSLIPLAPYTGADDPWQLECAICHHRGGNTTYSVIKRLGHVCMRCGRIRQADSRRLSEAEAVKSMVDAKLRPDVPYPGNGGLNWPCTCMRCKTVLRPGPRLADIRRGQGGCTQCADYGFNQNEPAHVYLVVNDTAGFLKWGKANNTGNRLQEHARQGFDRREGQWSFAVGAIATAVETATGEAVRALGATTRIARKSMRYKGYTETASLNEISVKEVWAIVDGLARHYQEL